MKEILTVRSNAFYSQKENSNDFEIVPQLEIVIIHTNGKQYNLNKKDLISSPKLDESRFIVTPELLQNLITDLQLHQKKLEGVRNNADQLNALVRHITQEKQTAGSCG